MYLNVVVIIVNSAKNNRLCKLNHFGLTIKQEIA